VERKLGRRCITFSRPSPMIRLISSETSRCAQCEVSDRDVLETRCCSSISRPAPGFEKQFLMCWYGKGAFALMLATICSRFCSFWGSGAVRGLKKFAAGTTLRASEAWIHAHAECVPTPQKKVGCCPFYHFCSVIVLCELRRAEVSHVRAKVTHSQCPVNFFSQFSSWWRSRMPQLHHKPFEPVQS
jgi:hypothetical protein